MMSRAARAFVDYAACDARVMRYDADDMRGAQRFDAAIKICC